MAKKKKKKQKKQNQESNKMLFAVAAGLVVLLVVFVVLTSNSRKLPSKKDAFAEAVAYLEKNPGVTTIKPLVQENRLLIVYNSDFKDDYTSMARYAGKKISHGRSDQIFTITLAKDTEDNTVFEVAFHNGVAQESEQD